MAAKSLCEWVRAVAEFTDVYTEIEKKEKVVAEKNLKRTRHQANKSLRIVQEIQYAVLIVLQISFIHGYFKQAAASSKAFLATNSEQLPSSPSSVTVKFMTVTLQKVREQRKKPLKISGRK